MPAVLGLVWLGGWWLWGLAAVASIAALHELYSMVRRPAAACPRRYGGALLALVGARLGGVDWMLAGFSRHVRPARSRSSASGLAPARDGRHGRDADGRQLDRARDGAPDPAAGRCTPSIGRYATFAVLPSPWADDTVAYFGGRLIGRHRMAPTLSPGKTWEGFVFGSAAAMLVAFFTLYKNGQNGFMDGWRPARPRSGDRGFGGDRRPLRVGAEARHGGQDTGRLLAGHGGVLDRIDALLFATVAGFYTILALS